MILLTDKHKIPFQIDDEDYEKVSKRSWCLDQGYIKTSVSYGSRQNRTSMCLHVFLLGSAPIGLEWDHINRDKLDNHKKNIKAVTHSENNKNKDLESRIKPTRSGISGIHINRDTWVVYYPPILLPPGKNILIGRFKDLDKAIRAQEEAANAYNRS